MAREGAADGAGRGDGHGRVVALMGDLAFAYDVSALAVARRLGVDIDVVVVDNGGGGIFDFLAQSSQQPPARFKRLWTTPLELDLPAVAKSFGVQGAYVGDWAELTARLDEPAHGVRVHVVRTDRRHDVEVHRRLHAAVEAAVDAAFLAQ